MLASVTLAWGCGGDSGAPTAPLPVPDPPRATTVTVSPTTAELDVGETVQLRAEVRDQNSNVMVGAVVIWTSSAGSVATVDASGLVTGVGEGTATITASSGSAQGTAAITVVSVPEPVASVEVSPSAETVAVGATLQLTAEAFDANGQAVAGAEFLWESSQTSVATVDASGLVTGVGEGTATITASSGSAQGTAAITVVNAVASSDRGILEAFYHATGGPNWGNSDNWLTDAPLGDWHGVRTDASGRVVGLRLSFNGLTGPIPAELGDLANLETLDLGFNELAGPIPPELGNLSSLTQLWVSFSGLTGSIPGELGRLSSLTHLRVGSNGLTGPIPPELGNLSSLESMDLSSNELTGPVPAELGDLANLETLDLGFNELAGPIPPELSNLSSLTQLWVSFNGLTGSIPGELGRLSSLTHLRLGSNGLTGPIPPELGNLSSLESMDLSSNELTGPIPAELGDLANLETLDLGFNELAGPIPPELGNLSSLTQLWVSFNGLTGSIPGELGRLSSLTHLRLGSNGLTGPIPPELGNLSSLESMDLSSNELTGPIPAELGNLANLETLDLGFNELAGPIPAELGNLSSLTQLWLSFNGLTSPIPQSFLQLDKLTAFSFGNNASLCAPSTPEFVTWLENIDNHSGPFCNGLSRACPVASPTWMGLPVCEEGIRVGYDRDDFGRAYESLEDEIIVSLPNLGATQVYTPYTCTLYDIRSDGTADTDIDHIVALAEAYDSGLPESQFREFGGDIENLTIAQPSVNRSQKGDRDAGEWRPAHNEGWFAARIVAVKQKYGLSVNSAELDALQSMLDSDPSREVMCSS